MHPSGVVVGTVIGGDHRVVERLGEGGMGAVYVALQLSTGKRRALKLMRGALVADPKLRERFLREARVAAELTSDHVVQVVGAGVDQESGAPWLSMELLDGVELAVYADAWSPLSAGEVREIFRQLTHGLGAAHDAGIVHRDLKPENVFLARAGRDDVPFTLKILDFGIAKLTAEALHKTTDTIGSPLWMAPEQAERGQAITTATDVWALGLIAFRLLTGSCFWLAALDPEPSSVKSIKEILFDPIPPASERAAVLGAPFLPDGFDAWFRRCVDREPGARFANARDAWRALEPLLPPEDGVALRALPPRVRRADPAFASTLERPDGALEADDTALAGVPTGAVRRRRALLGAALVLVVAAAALTFVLTRSPSLTAPSARATTSPVAPTSTPRDARASLPSRLLALSSPVVATGAGRVVVLSDGVLYELLPGDRAVRLSAGRGTADGAIAEARFNRARGVAIGRDGAIYVADTANHQIRVLRDGRVETLAGAGEPGFANGPRARARFNSPRGVAVDDAGVVYVADTGNNVIRVIRGDEVAVVAGTGQRGTVDGPLDVARFDGPGALAVTPSGAVWVVDAQTVRVVRGGRVETIEARVEGRPGALSVSAITARGEELLLATFAGVVAYRGGRFDLLDTPFAAKARGTKDDQLNPMSVAVGGDGTIYVGDGFGSTVRATDPTGARPWSTVAGSEPGYVDGVGADARFFGPTGVAVQGDKIFVADTGNDRVRVIDGDRVSTLDATKQGGGTVFRTPAGIAAGRDGALYVVTSCAVLAVRDGAVQDVVPERCEASKDGPLATATIRGRAIAEASDGALLVLDDERVRRIHDGRIDTIAGGGADRGDVDKPALAAAFSRLLGFALHADGRVVLAEQRRLFELHDDQVKSIAGGAEGYTDGVAALAAFAGITSVALGRGGELYVADASNHRIRVLRAGTVSTLAGDGEACTRDGPSLEASFGWISGLAVDDRGRLVVLDSNRVRVVADGRVTTIAGD